MAAFLVALFSGKISELLKEREATLIEMQDELAKKDRLASLVTLAAGAAHELSTPLATIAVVAKGPMKMPLERQGERHQKRQMHSREAVPRHRGPEEFSAANSR